MIDDHAMPVELVDSMLGALGFEHVKVVFEEPPKT